MTNRNLMSLRNLHAKSYQHQQRVSELAVTDDDSLIAWVDGTERYATRVFTGEGGLRDSICTCPYESDCKHGVAVVIENLKPVENNRRVPKAKRGDDRLELLEDEDWDKGPHEDETAMEIADCMPVIVGALKSVFPMNWSIPKYRILFFH